MTDTYAMQFLAPLFAGAYLPVSAATMRPAALAVVANDIVVHDRRRLLECGSGVSTIVLGRLLASRGGRVVTVEHDAAWVGVVRRLVAEHHLEDTVTIVEAPLVPAPVGQLDWYDLDIVSEAIAGYRFDLLLVDGPPAWRPGHELARLPALSVLAEHAAASCTIVLDDAERAGEAEIVEAWQRDCGITFRTPPGPGVAIGHRGEAPFGLL
jgi:predicted O-methyltransferase YrrM